MSLDLHTLLLIVFVVVILCWFAFASAFMLRAKPPKGEDRKKDRASIVGVVFQGLAYFFVWAIRRPAFTPIVANRTLATGLAILAALVAIGSVFLALAAVRTLGKEWSITARVIEGHKLATGGPYRFIRHPIYLAMLGMLVATGLAQSHWMALIAGIMVFLAGSVIRIRSEEILLRDTFGGEFEGYSRRVPALLPGIF